MATLQFGTSIRDITPSEPVMLHGYAARTRRSNGISEPLRLGALAVADGSTTVLLITVDTVGIHSTEVATLKEAIESRTGIGGDAIMIAASHTHFAPQISVGSFASPDIGFYAPEPSVVERTREAAVSAAAESIRDLQDGRLEVLRIPVPSVAFNRRTVRTDGSVETNFRYPEHAGELSFSPIDNEVTALRFRSDAGTGAVFVNFGCHPVTGGHDQERDYYRVSSDYVHYLRRSIEDAWGLPVFFTLGAAGDVVPRDRYGESRRRIGSIIGESVVLADRMFHEFEGAIATRSFTMPVETISTVDAAKAEASYEDERKRSIAAGEATDGFADALLARFRGHLYPENRYDVPVQLMRIGPVKLAALPFEVLSEFSLKMKAEDSDSVLVSCSGGYQGYLPFEYEYGRGGYEASERSTHFTPGTADRLLERVVSELASL